MNSNMQAPDSNLQLIKAKNGDPILKYKNKHLHSAYDPRKEASRYIKEIEKKLLKNSKQIFIFIGAGLGYNINEFVRHHKNLCIWLESNSSIINLALKYKKELSYLHEGLAKEQVKIFQDSQLNQNILSYIGALNQDYDVHFLLHQASAGIDPLYSEWHTKLQNFLQNKKINLATLSRFDKLWFKNTIANIDILPKVSCIQNLFNLVQGQKIAALICNAGPSLMQDIEKVKKLGILNSILLISVDTAAPILASQDIFPHIVVSVDPQALNCHHMNSFCKQDKTNETCFVFDMTTSYLSLRNLKDFSFAENRIFLMESPLAMAKILSSYKEGEDPAKITYGGSVSTNAYDLAVQMGCKTILLAGLDLAFTYNQPHARGSILEELRAIQKTNRLKTRELYNYSQLHALPQIHLPTKQHIPLASNDKLRIFYEWFRKRFNQDLQKDIQIINLTDKATYFEELPNRDISQLGQELDAFSWTSARKKLKSQIKTDTDTTKTYRKQAMLHKLKSLENNLYKYKQILQEELKKYTNEQAKEQSQEQGPSFQITQLNSLQKIAVLLLQEKELLSILQNFSQLNIAHITESAILQSNEPNTKIETLALELTKYINLYQSLLNGIEFVLPNIKKAQKIYKI